MPRLMPIITLLNIKKNEPAHEILVLSILSKKAPINACADLWRMSRGMRFHPHALCIQTAMAWAYPSLGCSHMQ